MPQHNTLLESYLRQLKLPTFAQHYTAFAQDATRTGLSCERYLLGSRHFYPPESPLRKDFVDR